MTLLFECLFNSFQQSLTLSKFMPCTLSRFGAEKASKIKGTVEMVGRKERRGLEIPSGFSPLRTRALHNNNEVLGGEEARRFRAFLLGFAKN